MAESRPKRFKAVLERLKPGTEKGLGWVIARVPFDPASEWKTMVRLRVRGRISAAGAGKGFTFRNSLFPEAGGGGYFLLVNKAMQKAVGVGAGDVAEFLLEPDLEERPAELPAELAGFLKREPGLRKWYDTLGEYTRREIGKYIAELEAGPARLKRAEQMAERLLGTMEAELETPPAIVAAFRRRPKAKIGWQKMTPTQRRMELFGVHAYKSPESRERRIEKLCDAAEKRA
jgi:hypothetical protein